MAWTNSDGRQTPDRHHNIISPSEDGRIKTIKYPITIVEFNYTESFVYISLHLCKEKPINLECIFGQVK
jgi:hypothetical protein